MAFLPLKTVFFLTATWLVASSPLSSHDYDSNKQWTIAEIPPSCSLNDWYPCFTNFTCAVLDVPLDYVHPELGRSYIPIIRYAATTTPYKGMVFTNPGGPGGSGIEFLQQDSATLIEIIGSNYDLVSWDPRGIGASIPSANCTLPADLKRRTLEPISGPYLDLTYFEANYNQSIAIGKACEESIGGKTQAGPHVTTATVARDMISMVDAFAASDRGHSIHDSSLINYWGISYGTFLGATFASMFPHRLGRFVLDGVVNPDDWSQATGQNIETFTDEVFSAFFVYCNAAGQTNCPFSTGTDARDIYLRFENIVSRLNATYAFQQGWSNATAIQTLLLGVKTIIFGEIYTPITGYPAIAEALVAIESSVPNVTMSGIEQLEQQFGIVIGAAPGVSDLWLQAILCTDNGGVEYGKTLPELLPLLSMAENQSWFTGEYLFRQLNICAGWPITSDDVFSGPFRAKTNNPILYVSNTLDNVTPIQNGVNGTTRFPGSQLLTIEGLGHSSLGPQNKCGWGKIGTFFQTGKLPGKENYCPLEAGPWNITFSGPLSRIADKRKLK